MTYPKWLNLLSRLTLLACLFVLVSACSSTRGIWGTVNWKEEVLLHDGQRIIVQRSHSRDSGGLREIGQGPPQSEESITFSLNGKSLYWRADFGRGYEDNLRPLVLDIVDGTPYLLTYPTRCHALNKWGRPNPPYVVFRHDGEQWQRIPLETVPLEIKKANLVIGSYPSTRNQVPESELKYGYIPAETVLRINEYMTRESLKYRLWIRREPSPGRAVAPRWCRMGMGGGCLPPDSGDGQILKPVYKCAGEREWMNNTACVTNTSRERKSNESGCNVCTVGRSGLPLNQT